MKERTFFFSSPWDAVEKAENSELPTQLDYRTEESEGNRQKIQGNAGCDTTLGKLTKKLGDFVNRNASIDFQVKTWDENEEIWMDRK